jgi:hypothetical protein
MRWINAKQKGKEIIYWWKKRKYNFKELWKLFSEKQKPFMKAKNIESASFINNKQMLHSYVHWT